MDHRTPRQHLLRRLLPTRGRAVAAAPDFADTRPEPQRPAQRSSGKSAQRRPGAFAESAVDLVLGTEVMEYPDDTAADLMDEFFATAKKRAA